MRLSITSVDYAPQELEAAVPMAVKLLRVLPGPDRPDYWLGELAAPFDLTIDEKPYLARYLVLAARWQGMKIEPNAEHVPINIAVVVNEEQLSEALVDFAKSKFIAIGLANEVEGGHRPEPLTNILSGTIGRFFGRGAKE